MKAVDSAAGARCPKCANYLRACSNARIGDCSMHGDVKVTPYQSNQMRELTARRAAEEAQIKKRLSSVPRYPLCPCGGALMLPEQAGKMARPGHLFCSSHGVQTGKLTAATAAQIVAATLAAKSEGFEI